MPHDVFISYSSLDKTVADKVCEVLERAEITCWIAPRDVTPGMNYPEQLVDAIDQCRLMVLILSSHSSDSEQVEREVERAVSKHVKIVPFRIDTAPLSKALQLFMGIPQWIDAATPPLEPHLQKLTEAIGRLLERRKEPSPVVPQKPLPKPPAKFSRKFALVFSTIVVIGLGYYFGPTIIERLRSKPIKSLAVLPFQRANDVPEWQSDGLTQVLIKTISQLPNIKIISSYSVFRYKNKSLNIKEAGIDLGVDAVLTGKMEKTANGLSVEVKLSDTKSDATIWKPQLSDSLFTVMRFAKEITHQLAKRLDIPFDHNVEQRLNRYYAKTNDAFDAYLYGLYESGKANSSSNELAITYFKQALDKDPAFAPALNQLAHTRQTRYENKWEGDQQLLVLASANCHQVLQLDSTNADAKAILSVIETLRGNISEATVFAEKALENDPNNLIALTNLGDLCLSYLNEPAKGVTYFKRVHEIEPLYWLVYNNLGIAYAVMNNLAEAGPAFRRATELDSNQYKAWLNLGSFYMHEASDDAASLCYERVLRVNPNEALTYEEYGSLLLARNEFIKAEKLYTQGTSRLQSNTSLLYGLGVTCALAGKKSLARSRFAEGLFVHQNQDHFQDADAYVSEGLFHARLGNASKARNFAAKAVFLHSTNDEVVVKAMRIYAVLRERNKMIDSFKRAKAINPFNYDAPFLRTVLDLESYRNDPDLLAIARRAQQ